MHTDNSEAAGITNSGIVAAGVAVVLASVADAILLMLRRCLWQVRGVDAATKFERRGRCQFELRYRQVRLYGTVLARTGRLPLREVNAKDECEQP